MNENDYSEDELEIIDFLENKMPQSIPNLEDEVKQLKRAAQHKVSQKNAVSLNLLDSDLEYLKNEAVKTHVSYQALMSSILHKYVKAQLMTK
ncbi:MAG: hypothetical protein KAG26_03025 [Methylococcales bacterium]|nr:hypothetical protein [Methylococcales bacterium]